MRDVKSRDDGAVATVAARPDLQDLYLASWADSFFAASLIVTLDLRVIWTNGAADRLVALGTTFCLIADRLACADKTQTPGLRTFVESLGEETALWTCRTESGPPMLVRGESLRPAGTEPAVALIIVPAEMPPERYLWGDLGAVFGLTRAEVAIVKRFVAGERADEMAEALGVTIETVRTHIRRIYNKLGINSREHLFSIVSPYRVR